VAKKSKPTRDVRPPSQEEISNSFIKPYSPNQGDPNPVVDATINRGEHRSFRGDTTKPFAISLKDIDETIIYYFDNVIRPFVVQNGERIAVPVVYGDAEKWKSIQKDGYYRDKNGKIMAPLITFRRTSFEQERGLGNKLLDSAYPYNFGVFQKKFNQRNVYDNFNVLNNRKPQIQYYGVIYPDFVNLTYTITIYTYYIEQMNKILESINYAANSYWGDRERFKFRTVIDNYTTAVELQQNTDRVVKSTFDLKLYGHLIPDVINKDIANGIGTFYNKTRIVFGLETTGSL
jgi:hypothetical protein